MKTAYKRLNRDHRIEIEKLIALGKNNKQIATAQPKSGSELCS